MSMVIVADDRLDAGESGCGELVMLIFERMKTLAPGQTLEVVAYDLAAQTDISSWCRVTGNVLVMCETDAQPRRFIIRKKI
jgi:tRNA 2-thiouridine synthesizing protein A